MQTQKYKIGIDLGGTNINTGIVNSKNEIISTHKMKTLTQRPWQEIVNDMFESAKKSL